MMGKYSSTLARRRAALPHLLVASLALAAVPGAHALAGPKTAEAPAVQVDDAASLKLARTFRAGGDSRSAIPIYQRLVDRKDADPDVQVELGDTLLESGLFDQAIGAYQAVPAGSRAGGEAELGLARVQLALNQPARALAHADRAVQLAPANERVLIGRGVVLDRLGRHPDAQTSYRAALKIEPRSVAARSDLALSLAMTQRYDEALEILEPIARSADATAQDRQNLAFVYGLKGDRQEALALSRVDLPEAAAQANVKYFETARQPRPH